MQKTRPHRQRKRHSDLRDTRGRRIHDTLVQQRIHRSRNRAARRRLRAGRHVWRPEAADLIPGTVPAPRQGSRAGLPRFGRALTSAHRLHTHKIQLRMIMAEMAICAARTSIAAVDVIADADLPTRVVGATRRRGRDRSNPLRRGGAGAASGRRAPRLVAAGARRHRLQGLGSATEL